VRKTSNSDPDHEVDEKEKLVKELSRGMNQFFRTAFLFDPGQQHLGVRRRWRRIMGKGPTRHEDFNRTAKLP